MKFDVVYVFRNKIDIVISVDVKIILLYASVKIECKHKIKAIYFQYE